MADEDVSQPRHLPDPPGRREGARGTPEATSKGSTPPVVAFAAVMWRPGETRAERGRILFVDRSAVRITRKAYLFSARNPDCRVRVVRMYPTQTYRTWPWVQAMGYRQPFLYVVGTHQDGKFNFFWATATASHFRTWLADAVAHGSLDARRLAVKVFTAAATLTPSEVQALARSGTYRPPAAVGRGPADPRPARGGRPLSASAPAGPGV